MLTPQVKQDIKTACLHIRADAPETACRWRLRMLNLVKSPSTFSDRHEIAAEARDTGVELRQMLYGSYRIMYTVEADGVRIHAL